MAPGLLGVASQEVLVCSAQAAVGSNVIFCLQLGERLVTIVFLLSRTFQSRGQALKSKRAVMCSKATGLLCKRCHGSSGTSFVPSPRASSYLVSGILKLLGKGLLAAAGSQLTGLSLRICL